MVGVEVVLIGGPAARPARVEGGGGGAAPGRRPATCDTLCVLLRDIENREHHKKQTETEEQGYLLTTTYPGHLLESLVMIVKAQDQEVIFILSKIMLR